VKPLGAWIAEDYSSLMGVTERDEITTDLSGV